MGKILQELLENKKQDTIEKFADYLLNKMKRDISFSIKLDNGYLMAGYGTFICNDIQMTRIEAKQVIINECNKIIKC